MFKKLLNNKNKLIELTRAPLNKNCSAVVLKKFPEKLGRPFLSTSHAIINVHEREIILRQDQQSLTIQCSDIPSIKKVEQINKIDFIDPGGRYFDSKEIENFINDDSIPIGVEDSPFNMEEDILFLESLLREEPCPNPPIIPNQTKFPFEEPKHSFNMGYEHFNTNLVTNDIAESSTKNLVPIPRESEESDPQQEEIDVVTETDDVLPPSVKNNDSDVEVDDVDDLRVDNPILNSEHESSDSEDSDFDNPSVPLPPPKPPDEEFDFEIDFGDEISVVRSTIVEFEFEFDAKVKFDVFNDENDDYSYFMFANVFSFLSAESEDTIFDPGSVDPTLFIRRNDNDLLLWILQWWRNPNHVYKLKKALYRLKQAPRAWYDMLSSFLLSQDFSKGSVDPTLFIRRNDNDLLLMSMMGKISFFLGLQISQNPRGIFFNKSKFALESLKKYGFESYDPVETPMVEKSKLDEDRERKAVDPSHYRGMIGTLLYLTANRPDFQFAICMCARYQAWPTKKHDFFVALTAFADADHAGCQDTRRSTSGKYQLADLFTKALGRDRIEFLTTKLGMRSFTPETLKQLMIEEDE
nr:hypothetical protein [Tanacetum cinerariifolium]